MKVNSSVSQPCRVEVKIEQDDIGNWDDYNLTPNTTEHMGMQVDADDMTVKLDPETYVDSKTLGYGVTTQLFERVDIKNENDGMNSISNKEEGQTLHRKSKKGLFNCYHCNYTANNKVQVIGHLKAHKNGKNVYSCYCCNYKTYLKKLLTMHLRVHSRDSSKTDASEFRSCMFCNVVLRHKRSMNNHILKKHPEYIASVTSKVHECKICLYKTMIKRELEIHMLKHNDPNCSYKLSTCMHCNAAFSSNQMLTDHILRKHPKFVESITQKIHECKVCNFKTAMKCTLDRHMLNHPDVKSNSKFRLSSCSHCSATFKTKTTMDDHVIRKHPEFIGSVTSKVHECEICIFKTTNKRQLERHMSKHPEANSGFKPSTCSHCNAEFKTKRGLDNHILNNHPKFSASVTSKIHECKICKYKTAIKSSLDAHMLNHSGENYTCVHCKAVFKSKRAMNDHVSKKHPEFIASVTSKIHECEICMFKTTSTTHLSKHMLTHLEEKCLYCKAVFKTKNAMDNHIVRKHTKTEILECRMCTYKTKINKYFEKHMLKHREAK